MMLSRDTTCAGWLLGWIRGSRLPASLYRNSLNSRLWCIYWIKFKYWIRSWYCHWWNSILEQEGERRFSEQPTNTFYQLVRQIMVDIFFQNRKRGNNQMRNICTIGINTQTLLAGGAEGGRASTNRKYLNHSAVYPCLLAKLALYLYLQMKWWFRYRICRSVWGSGIINITLKLRLKV